MKKIKKKLPAVLTALTLLLSLTPASLAAGDGLVIAPAPAGSATVYVTIADKGEVVMAREAVTVTDIDADGALTVNDALFAAHEAGCEGGAEAGYASGMTDYGLSLMKLWGDDSGVSGYWLNDASCLSLADPVSDGDYVVAFNYADPVNYSDAYARFVEKEFDIKVGDTITLTLEKAGYDENWNTVFEPFEGDTVVKRADGDGSLKVWTAHHGSSYDITFGRAGTYIVTGYSQTNSIVPAVAVVNVEAYPYEDLSFTPGAGGRDTDSLVWYSVVFAHENGLMFGVGDGLFDPGGVVNRAMAASVLYRLEGRPEVEGENTFTDVPDGEWYTQAVLWAEQSGVVSGYGDGSYLPLEPVSQEEMAQMFYAYAQYKGFNTSARAEAEDYFDASNISGWAEEAMLWALEEGVVLYFAEAGADVPRGDLAIALRFFVENVAGTEQVH